MSAIAVNSKVLKQVIETSEEKFDLTVASAKTTTIELTDENKTLLEFLSDNIKLPAAQSKKLNTFLFGNQNLKEVSFASTQDLYRKINYLSSSIEPQFELKINNRWYPVLCHLDKFKTRTGDTIVSMNLTANIDNMNYNKEFMIGPWDFLDDNEKPVKKTVELLLEKKSVRFTTPEAVENCRKQISRINKLNNSTQKVFDCYGDGLYYHPYWGWGDINMGSKESPNVVIVEKSLESGRSYWEEREDLEDSGSWRLPFIRIFSLKFKQYVFVDVEDLHEHIYHKDMKDKIVLPDNMRKALDSIFSANQGDIFGDLFHGRHGGIVVLANGPSGVGKTLTAEVFAEFQERPLYIMEMSEVGTTLKEVETNLQKIFARAKAWNAVLLFDEADIFLSERVASDLERSAIVGIFLRLLDYYEGTFFLTTNRGAGIDKAFKSRVTLYLNYPDLSDETRKTIWQSMLKSANIEVTGSEDSWNKIASVTLNGRQIRNQVRLLKLMYPQTATTADIEESLEFTAH